MRFLVILLVSFVARSSAQILQVKCGDEKCERPSNKAVTTLRYTPDKPYKLQIFAVNSEVEIFGMTDELYYIRHGKNYGFLPKNHLREKSRGNYPFKVEIDIGSKRIDQHVREGNFLFEFLKSSQLEELKLNDTLSESATNEQQQPSLSKEPVQQIIEDNPGSNVKLDAISDDKVEAKVEVPEDKQSAPVVESDEDDNDSGIDDNEEDDDDEEEDSEEEASKLIQNPEQQPELVAIPPSKDSEVDKKPDLNDEIPSTDEKPLALPVAASAQEILTPPQVMLDDAQNVTAEEPSKVNEKVPEFVPIKSEAVEEAQQFLDIKNATDDAPAVDRQDEAQIVIPMKPTIIIEKPAEVEKVKTLEEPLIENNNGSYQEPLAKLEAAADEKIAEPAPVNEIISELPLGEWPQHQSNFSEVKVLNDAPGSVKTIKDNLIVESPSLQNEMSDGIEHTPPPASIENPIAAKDASPLPQTENPIAPEVASPPPQIENPIAAKDASSPPQTENPIAPEVASPPPQTENPIAPEVASPPPQTENPIAPEDASPPPQTENPVNTEVPQNMEIPVSDLAEPTTLPLQQKPTARPEPDALLQRFNQKLGNRGSLTDNTGHGTVEPLHRPEQHHNNDHSHSHDHNHIHEHVEAPGVNEEILPEIPIVEEEPAPGFFGGLFKKFFSDEDDSEQHFQKKPIVENAFNPSPDQSSDTGFCEKIDSENCPQSLKTKPELNYGKVDSEWKTADEYVRTILNEAIEMMDLIISMSLTSLTVLIFTLGYYCINKARKEGPLIAKMNDLERHLMAAVKENDMLRGDVTVTKQKLLSIEDNSFGSNDMVIALKQELDSSEQTKFDLSEKIAALERELEAAAEDGLELNRMVSELLNNQSGSESIISSVEDLQRQLNEQQETIVTMNETLAAKSRENSELQVQLSEINGKFNGEFENLHQQIDAVTLERTNLQIELENLKRDSDVQVNQLIEERNGEVTRLNNELTAYAKNHDEKKKLLNSAEAKVQALDECLKAIKKDSKGVGFKDLFDIADLKADLLAVTKEKSTLQEQLQNDTDSRKLLDDRVKFISEEMSTLKKEFGVAEKEKLEAQTRLEVLSTYFKEKETQLQKELSVKEARWMQQQGETTSTVEKVQALNNEIQTLKSQNDSLRAEIGAQVAAHKLNISSLEGQSHAAWLNARQAERKLEESRMESAALRRRLTSIAENPAGSGDLLNGIPGMINDTMNSISSPIRVESPNNPNGLPPAPMMMPPFLPQGFLPGAPLPFMPPAPFMPGEMPPLGRLMSPPPKRFTPTMRDDRDRYSPRGRSRYSPDSRYDDYTAFETETDYSPPPSPSPPRRGYSSPSDRSKKSKGGHSSAGSIESNPTSRRK